jgi:hypothetical protein
MFFFDFDMSTPYKHIISETYNLFSKVLSVFVENYERYKAGEPMKHVVDWSKGY